MRAVSYYMIVETIKEKRTMAGLDITDSIDSENRYLKAKIISNGDLIPDVLQEGDIIYYDRHAGHSITSGDNIYQVIQIKDVVIVE
jgi:co-chaperonin GroES (HSP10)